MSNEPGGAIQVLDNSTAAINQALAQVLERVDDLKGLRGPVTVHDRLRVAAPLDPLDAINLETLVDDFVGNMATPFAWPGLGNTQRPGELPGDDAQLDAADPLLWLFGAGTGLGGSEPLNAPPEVETASVLGAIVGRYAREDHTHSGVNIGDAQTITGAKTFDLDPAAPFVVTASSAVVTNLDSDKWDGQDYETGTFTATATGFAVDPSGTARYVKLGALVALWLPTLTGTSDATTFTITGLPAALTPTQSAHHAVRVSDNGTFQTGRLTMTATSTTIDVNPTMQSNALMPWTPSGPKQLSTSWIVYASI